MIRISALPQREGVKVGACLRALCLELASGRVFTRGAIRRREGS